MGAAGFRKSEVITEGHETNTKTCGRKIVTALAFASAVACFAFGQVTNAPAADPDASSPADLGRLAELLQRSTAR